jgi:hypothetical protein
LRLMATSMDATKSCLGLVALLRKIKVNKYKLMPTSMGSEDTAKSWLDLVALLRQIKESTVVVLPVKYICF